MKIGARIKQRRLEIGMSVEELADALGKNRATVYRYENGDIENMPTPILEPIARILNTTPAYLMGYEENLEGNADFITEILKDSILLEHLHSLIKLDNSKKQSVYDMIDFLSKEKGL